MFYNSLSNSFILLVFIISIIIFVDGIPPAKSINYYNSNKLNCLLLKQHAICLDSWNIKESDWEGYNRGFYLIWLDFSIILYIIIVPPPQMPVPLKHPDVKHYNEEGMLTN